MGLQIKISPDLRRIVQEYIVHWDIISQQMCRTLDQLYHGERAAEAIHDRLRVGIDCHNIDFRDLKQGSQDMMEEGLSGQQPVILTGHPLAVVPHGNKSACLHFIRPSAGKLIPPGAMLPGAVSLADNR